MKKLLIAAAVVLGIAGAPFAQTAEAAACPNIYKFSWLTYNYPIYAYNNFSWSALPNQTGQVWVVERSHDNGANFYEVQRSTARSYTTYYPSADNVIYRFFSTTSVAQPCSPDGAVISHDPVPGVGGGSNIYP